MRKLLWLCAGVFASLLPRRAAPSYVGSAACKTCHSAIYARWQKTPMANVVRDPKEHPEAIIPDLTKPDPLVKFKKEDIALVYGSIWKQRYFTKVGNDYFPLGAQWDITHQIWRAYFVANNTDWWVPFYPADNMKRPTGAAVRRLPFRELQHPDQDRHRMERRLRALPRTRRRSHREPHRGNIVNPARLNTVAAIDTCIQCHSQGQPLQKPINGTYYDWPVGYEPGKNLRDFWQLEEHKIGETTFTHFADGTAHKNRMQGNDFVQSAMYSHGITCFSCHDVHGTDNNAQLLKPASVMCLQCHGPSSPNGPHAPTIEAHTQHKAGSAGNECVNCHMPKIETQLADVNVRAHTFKFIPPSATVQNKVPNACNTCHNDKTPEWASEALRKWPGRSPWRVE